MRFIEAAWLFLPLLGYGDQWFPGQEAKDLVPVAKAPGKDPRWTGIAGHQKLAFRELEAGKEASGTLIAFQTNAGVCVANDTGVCREMLCPPDKDGFSSSLWLDDETCCWSPDGKRLGCPDRQGAIWTVDLAARKFRQVFTPPTPGWRTIMGGWSPDGKRLLFYGGTNNGHWTLYVVDVDEAKFTQLAQHVNPRESGWASDGRSALFQRHTITYALDLETRRESPMKEITGGKTSPDGRKLAFISFRDNRNGLYVLDLKTGQETGPLERKDLECVTHFAWSPDNCQLAFTSYRLKDGQTIVGGDGVFVVNTDGSGLRRITDAGPMQYCPVWSPDGKQIAFARAEGKSAKIHVVNADGTRLTCLTCGSGYKSPLAWSPEGRHIAFHSGDSQIHLIDVATPQEISLAPNPAPQWINANKEKQLVFHVQGRQYRFDGFAEPQMPAKLSHDGKHIVSVEPVEGGWSELFIANRDGSEKRQITDIPMTNKGDAVWRDDDRKIAFSAMWFKQGTWEQPDDPREHIADGLYVIDADGNNLCRASCSRSFRPYWQPAPTLTQIPNR